MTLLIDDPRALTLLEGLRRTERATWGVDPDGTAYLDAADRVDRARAAYRARLAEVDGAAIMVEERRTVVAVIGAEVL